MASVFSGQQLAQRQANAGVTACDTAEGERHARTVGQHYVLGGSDTERPRFCIERAVSARTGHASSAQSPHQDPDVVGIAGYRYI